MNISKGTSGNTGVRVTGPVWLKKVDQLGLKENRVPRFLIKVCSLFRE